MSDGRTNCLSRHLSIWGPFVLATLLTLAIDRVGWHLPIYYWLLSILGLLSLALGLHVIWHTRRRPWVIAVVAASLVVGQLWFFELAVFVVFYSFQPFAP
jgi:uncharacterized membrane protein YqgA involved in biofilm formation